MLLDANLQLSNAQAITTTAFSTNTVDQGAIPMVQRKPLYAAITVDQSATAAGAATVTFQLVSSASANLSSPTVLGSSDAIPISDLQAARKPIFVKGAMTNMPAGHRYVGLQYFVGTGPLTAGAFTCYLTDDDINTGAVYAGGFNVA